MTKDTDQMSTLAKLKPVTVIETSWPAPVRDAAFERVLRAAEDSPQASRPSRRRLVIAAAMTAVLVGSGVGVAAAEGILPESFTQNFSFWTSETHGAVEIQKARRVAQTPGPDADVLSFWTATGKNGTACMSLLYESPGEVGRAAPKQARSAGGECPRVEQQAGGTFGDLGGSAEDSGIHTMWGPMGKAVRAELRLSDGSVRPVGAAEGYFFFWYLANRQVDPPVLVGYDSAGHVVSKRRLANLLTGDHGGGVS